MMARRGMGWSVSTTGGEGNARVATDARFIHPLDRDHGMQRSRLKKEAVTPNANVFRDAPHKRRSLAESHRGQCAKAAVGFNADFAIVCERCERQSAQ